MDMILHLKRSVYRTDTYFKHDASKSISAFFLLPEVEERVSAGLRHTRSNFWFVSNREYSSVQLGHQILTHGSVIKCTLLKLFAHLSPP